MTAIARNAKQKIGKLAGYCEEVGRFGLPNYLSSHRIAPGTSGT
jgi:hypothetical protein